MLPRTHRLPSLEIPTLMRNGKRISKNGVTLIYRTQNSELRTQPPRFAFIVSTKVDKRAVVRNRMRRLMSESVRHQMEKISPGLDGIFIGSKALIGLTQEQVKVRVHDLILRVH